MNLYSALIVGYLSGSSTVPLGAPEEGPVPEDLRGAWQCEEPPLVLYFEACKVTVDDGHRVHTQRVLAYRNDRAVVLSHDGPTDLEVWREGDAAGVVWQDEVLELQRLAEIPESVQVKPWPMAEATPLDPETLAGIQAELADRMQVDQEVRQGENLDFERMLTVDRDNTAYIKQLVQQVGWIDAGRFGPEATQAAFLLVQHSMDRPLMLASLPAIERDVRAGLTPGSQYALLFDRLQLQMGELQRYGSQIILREGKPIVQACEDPEGVDARRREMGLGPLREYVSYFGGTEVVFQSLRVDSP